MWQKYVKTAVQEMRPYVPGESLNGISVSQEDLEEINNPDKKYGMIARNSSNHNDQWYVARKFFEDNYELVVLKDV